jgi:AcrR family transcriptional regulator
MTRSSPSRALPAVQPRSQQTRDRLLDAAEALLADKGVEAATVPEIARRAGVAVGSLYRRFPDKDAVMKAVYERFFAQSREWNSGALRTEAWDGVGAVGIVETVICRLVSVYLRKRQLLSALVQYAETHVDVAFRRQADLVRRESFDAIARLLLARRQEIGHRSPERAIEFALLAVGSTLKQLVLQSRAAVNADQLSADLTELVVRYLQISPAAKRSSSTRRTRR